MYNYYATPFSYYKIPQTRDGTFIKYPKQRMELFIECPKQIEMVR
jgi:hypothetical protein